MGNANVTGKTVICGVFGDPIGHTKSPLMHNAAFAQLGLDYCYLPFRVAEEELDGAVAGLRAMNIRGVNITIPHKVAVMPLLDKINPLAEKIGAVNTIVNDGGVLSGDNTDATGFLQALLEGGVEPKGKNIIILGAGGASRAISFVLAERGARIVILNRTQERAKDLAHRVSNNSGAEVTARQLDEPTLASELEKADVLINTTSLGMSPNSEGTPVPARLLKSDLVVSDIIYNPLQTRLLKEAEAAGARTISGMNMLVWQGALASEMWTGQKAPVDTMRAEVIKGLSHEN